jgi:hypothetical protein
MVFLNAIAVRKPTFAMALHSLGAFRFLRDRTGDFPPAAHGDADLAGLCLGFV